MGAATQKSRQGGRAARVSYFLRARRRAGALGGGVGGLILLIAIATGVRKLTTTKEVPKEVSVEVTSTAV